MADSRIATLSLCSGVGGLELGLGAAIPGLRVVGYVEREAYAACTLLARMEAEDLEPAPVWGGDLADCPFEVFGDEVDLVCAGFPCQPWSVAGSQKGTADDRWIWDDIVGCLRTVRPRWVVLENVPGLVSGGGIGPVFSDLAALGFDAEWGCLTAAAVGASHRRERWFCLAYREGDRLGETGLDRSRRRTGQCDSDLADTDREQGPGDDLADSRGAERRPLDEHDQLSRGRLEEAGRPRAAGPGVADTRSERPQGIVRAGTAPGSIGRSGMPLFAPGPADLELWARVLAEAPEVEPAFCRIADGMADRLDFRADRLRACGNGVVPLQAAVAISLLAARAGVNR